MAKKNAGQDIAFVPVEEQPYQVPENWRWVRLGDIAQWGSGGTPSRKNSEFYNGDIPWLKTGELDDTFIFDTEEKITQSAVDNSSAKVFPVNTVIIAMYGATIGKTGILGIESTTNQACACAVSYPVMNYLYLFYYLQSQKKAFIYEGKGGAQPNISQTVIKKHKIPVPPLAEQQRIVDRIESLFAKLDEAKEKAQAALDSFEERKAAILYKAFTGKLTEKWREKSGTSLEITYRDFVSCISSMKNGLSKRHGTSGTGTVVLRLANLIDNSIDTSGLNEILLTDDEIESYGLKPKDVLMIRVNGSKENVGRQIMYNENKTWAFCDHIIRIRYADNIMPQYMIYFSRTNAYRDYISEHMVSSAGQNTISRKGMSELLIPIPLFDEQVEIVRILDSFFSMEAEAREQVESTLTAIDTMKKAILARAFRGELGTNDPDEETVL